MKSVVLIVCVLMAPLAVAFGDNLDESISAKEKELKLLQLKNQIASEQHKTAGATPENMIGAFFGGFRQGIQKTQQTNTTTNCYKIGNQTNCNSY